MDMRVYFFKVDIFNSETNEEENYRRIKNDLISIIDSKAIDYNEMKVVELLPEDPLHYIADVFDYKDDCLFMRLCGQQQSGAYLRRDYKDNIPQPVLVKNYSEEKIGIEAYTYLFYKYDTGIAGIVNHKNAPKGRKMEDFYKKYLHDYYLKLTPILNAHGIRMLAGQEESSISRIEIELPLPDAAALQDLLGCRFDDILNLQAGQQLKAIIDVSATGRQMITNDADTTDRLIDRVVRSFEQVTRKIKFRGKVGVDRTQDYCLSEEIFTYPVEVTTYRIINGKKVYLPLTERVSQYRQSLKEAYNTNINTLQLLTGRNDGERE